MKKFCFSLIIGWLIISASLAQTEKNVPSQISSVTVFLNRAQITNTAQVYLTAGTTQLIFEQLSTKIDKQSIQVSAKGNLTIMAVKHQINYLKNQTKTSKSRDWKIRSIIFKTV